MATTTAASATGRGCGNVCLCNNTGQLRQVGEHVVLVSDNPEIEITPIDEAEIVGPVLWARRYYRR